MNRNDNEQFSRHTEISHNARVSPYACLRAGSPVINKGGNAFYSAGQTPDLSAVTTDRGGNPRFRGSAVDLGAYEY
jgi:hypothetical protein